MSLRFLSLAFAAAVAAGCQPPEPTAAAPLSSQAFALWSDRHDRPELLSGSFEAPGGSAEEAARGFLLAHASAFHLDSPGLALELTQVKRGLAGDYVRFAQRQGRAIVFSGEVIVLVSAKEPRRVLAVNLSHHEEAAQVVPGGGDIGAARALSLSLETVGAAPPFRVDPELEAGLWVPGEGRGRKGAAPSSAAPARSWRARVSTEAPPHDWEIFVDAASGAVLEVRDRVVYVDGTGLVFDANPVASTGDGSLRDNADTTSTALDGARFSVTLPRLDSSGYTRGSYVDARTKNVASRLMSAAFTYDFTRAQSPSFEQVNVYYHLDRVQHRIQADLGITSANNRMQLAIVDAQNNDNSFFTATSNTINYGLGGVDDAEDGDIVVHEYGHAMQHDQVASWGGGDEGAMGEGFGDYLAGSMAQTLGAAAGHPLAGDPACVGDWDATAYVTTAPRCLRRLDSTKHYPEAEVGEVHDDGEMWSAALWGVRAQLGADVADKDVIEAQFLLSGSATFFTASTALVTADTNVHAGANATLIRRRMIEQGLSRTLTAVDAGTTVLASIPVSIDNPRGATGNYPDSFDNLQGYTVPGAAALSVHFTRVELETNNQCLTASCDNIYVINPAGDLFQVITGVRSTAFSTPAVEGDTVLIRLVTDVNTARFGYHVDRIDVLGVVDGGLVDGGFQLDSGVYDSGVADSGVPDSGVADSGVADSGAPDSGAPDSSVPDSGAPDSGVDSGTSDDGGTSSVPVAKDVELGKVARTGCGCVSADGGAWLALSALVALRRRRGQAAARTQARSAQ